MTGEPDRRKQALSVFLSTLMVLSVLAMGMAGFAGSAAAVSQSDSDLAGGEAVATADPANAGAVSEMTFVANASSGSFDGTNLSNVTINFTDPQGVDIKNFTSTGSDDDLSSEVNLYVGGSEVDITSVSASASSSRLEISGIESGSGSQSLPDGATVTVELIGDDDLINPDANAQADVIVKDTGTGEETFSTEFTVDDGPIELDVDGAGIEYYHTLHKAVGAATSNDVVTVTEDLDETGPTAAGTSAQVGAGDVTIQGSGSPTIDVSGYGADIINLNSQTNVTVDGLTFETDGLGQAAVTGTTTNSTVSGNTFNNFTITTVDLTTSNTGDVDTLSVSDNTFDGDEGGAISVTDASFAQSGDTITIDSNDISLNSGATAIAIAGAAGGSEAQVDISSGTIEGAIGQSDTGISINNNNSVDIDGTTLNGTETGIASNNNLGSFLNISSVTLTNQENRGIDIQDDTTLNVDGISIDSSSDATGIYLGSGAASSVDITESNINDTDVGVDLSDSGTTVDDLNVTSNTISNAGTAGLQLNNPGANSNNIRVHFNTFDSNAIAVDVDTDLTGNSETVDLTFNDFTNSGSDALDVGVGQSNAINANYSWWDNRDSSRIVGPYTPQNAGSQLPIPRRVYSYTRLHTGGQP